MSNNVFHGSPIDIKDFELKPGYSRHIESHAAVYLTEFSPMALTYALDYGNLDKDDAQSVAFYNHDIQDWETFIIAKTPSTALGYIYEVERPVESPVSYYDSQNDTEISQYKPGAFGVWAVSHNVPILHKHIVNYNYMKQNPLNITVRTLKKRKVFEDAILKIKESARAIENTSPDKKAAAIEIFRQVLDEYTDR